MAFNGFEDTFLRLTPCGAFSYSWHISFPLNFVGSSRLLAAAEWANPKPRSKLFRCSSVTELLAKRDSGRLDRRAVHHRRTADASGVLGVLTAHKMPGTGATTLDLTVGGYLDSLLQPLVGLLFRHFNYFPLKKS